MTRFTRFSSYARMGLVVSSVLALAACVEELENPFAARDAVADGPAPIGATRLVERDVEAPEIFQVSQDGLWDGRPSLGGVWVAHPDVTDPERVIIRNEENGRFVIGALFRRERENPGPELMVSSDAAAALNVLAGDPTMLQVTALRREEVAEPDATPATDAPVATAAALDTGEITATALGDPIAAAAAAIAETADTAPNVAADDITAAVAAAPASASEVEATPAVATAAPTNLDRPFVQIGIFSVEENATNTGQALRGAGLVPTIYDQTSNDRRFWRVVVGPANSSDDRAAILETVRGLGFEDAYFVSR